jgi:hypothetical protein
MSERLTPHGHGTLVLSFFQFCFLLDGRILDSQHGLLRYRQTANQRKDFLHKLSRQITNAYTAVVIEDLNMRGMAQGLHSAQSTNIHR